MENLNVSTMDTRDSKGRGRFFPFNPDNHYFPGDIHAGDYWYWDYIYYPPTQVCVFT
jgi:glycoprotein-N-acetylgalactosamine 3-beta-galactosyltransferase